MAGFGDYFNKAKDYVSFRQFLTAVTNGDSRSAADYLKRKPADIDRQESLSGRNALMCALTANAAGTVKLLLDRGASLRGQDKDGYNALHLAIICTPKVVTDMLLQAPGISAIINEKNRHTGLTALMYAAMVPEDTGVVQSLLEKGADLNARDFLGRTALDIARAKGATKTAVLLVQWKPKTVIRRPQSKKGGFGF